MSDPDERLSSFDPGPAMNPLPPSDVRRQGDRLRRRNTVLAGVGAAVAVAVIVTPLAILGTRGDGDASPDPAPPASLPQPAVGDFRDALDLVPADAAFASFVNRDAGADRDADAVGHRIAQPFVPVMDRTTRPRRSVTLPDGIDITTGMAENESREPVVATADGEGVAEMVMCDAPALPDDGVLDRLAAHASGPEYTDARELRPYGSVDEARAVIDGWSTRSRSARPRTSPPPRGSTRSPTEASARSPTRSARRTSRTASRPSAASGGTWCASATRSSWRRAPERPSQARARRLPRGGGQPSSPPIVNGFVCVFSETSCSSEGAGPRYGFPAC